MPAVKKLKPGQRPLLDDQDLNRFLDKIDFTETCWLWIGGCNKKGYGNFKIEKRQTKAHRVSYEWFIGPIPEGLELDHLCRVRNCVYPLDLEPVTHLENVRRGVGNQNLNKTHCKHGHEFTEVNTYIRPEGKRNCRTCQRIRQRKGENK
jgi:hypothetical protein